MSVQRLHAEAVVDDDAVAVDAEIRRVDDHSGLRRLDRHLLRDREIESQMHLAIDLLAHVGVGAEIGELRFHRRVGERLERRLPHHLGRRLLREPGDRLGVAAPQVAVDLHEGLRKVLGRR